MSESKTYEALKQEASRSNGVLTYAEFTKIALYQSEYGYYQKKHLRVGRNREADFYTAESLGAVFAELVYAAAVNLLDKADTSEYTFIELGAEAGSQSLTQFTNSFRAIKAYSLNDPIELSGRCVVFANELLDAQPFHRLIFKNGKWHECAVTVPASGKMSEICLLEFSEPVHQADLSLPQIMPEGYRLDISLEAERLLERICTQNWIGPIMMFDYGRFWEELLTAYPAGTARGYYRHQVSDRILEKPGEQDLTCHVCWDRMEAILQKTGFKKLSVKRQEAFWVSHAECAIERIIKQNPGQFDPARQTLMELIHPQHMGGKFQVLSAIR